MRPIEGIDAAQPPACAFCGGEGIDSAESDGRCTECAGTGVDTDNWWWEIAWLRNQLTQLRAVETVHAEGEGALNGTCVLCLQDWPCAGFAAQAST